MKSVKKVRNRFSSSLRSNSSITQSQSAKVKKTIKGNEGENYIDRESWNEKKGRKEKSGAHK